MPLKKLRPGDRVFVPCKCHRCPATVLVIMKGQALIEYEGPGGWTALRFVPDYYDPTTEDAREPQQRVGYTTLRKPWYQALVRSGAKWVNRPQNGTDRWRGSPVEVYLQKFGGMGQMENLSPTQLTLPIRDKASDWPGRCVHCGIIEPLNDQGLCAWSEKVLRYGTYFPDTVEALAEGGSLVTASSGTGRVLGMARWSA